MQLYFVLKTIHIVSAAVLFGTGIGIAFFMLRAYQSQNFDAMSVVTRNVVLADWVFTTPAVLVQFVTGMWLMFVLGMPLNSVWFAAVLGLFVFVGACWIPVVSIQIRILRLLQRQADLSAVRRLMTIWIALGIPAFASVIGLYVLMVLKPGMGTPFFGAQ